MLELWFDFSCPYAYLASRRAPALGTAIDWRPMLLGGIFRGLGTGDGPMATLSAAKAAHNLHDMHRWAHLFGEPFRMPAAHPMRTVRALRVLLALPGPRWPAAIEAIFAAYWQRGEDITRDEVIAGALAAAGLAGEEVAAAFARAEDADIKDELRRRTDEALALGIFGAPAWIRAAAGPRADPRLGAGPASPGSRRSSRAGIRRRSRRRAGRDPCARRWRRTCRAARGRAQRSTCTSTSRARSRTWR